MNSVLPPQGWKAILFNYDLFCSYVEELPKRLARNAPVAEYKQYVQKLHFDERYALIELHFNIMWV